MTAHESLSIVFAKRPEGEIVPGETFSHARSPASTEADLKEGDVLFETHYLSLDPSMRIWLKGRHAAYTRDTHKSPRPLTIVGM